MSPAEAVCIMKQQEISEKMLKKLNELHSAQNFRDHLIVILSNIGPCYMQMGCFDKEKNLLDRALVLAEEDRELLARHGPV
jgi:Tfp pilus assembly protein PilF